VYLYVVLGSIGQEREHTKDSVCINPSRQKAGLMNWISTNN